MSRTRGRRLVRVRVRVRARVRVAACPRRGSNVWVADLPGSGVRALCGIRLVGTLSTQSRGRALCGIPITKARRRLIRAPEAAAGRPVAEPRPGRAGLPRAARRALRRRRKRAGALPRGAL
eukprot:scaffold1328_cov59-Phaeocystis_antarctica.AAC.1